MSAARAEVWRMWPGSWGVQVFTDPDRDTGHPIRRRRSGRTIFPLDGITFPTHRAAMDAALAEVGLTPHPEDCDCDRCCTHEITHMGACAGCGASIEYDW